AVWPVESVGFARQSAAGAALFPVAGAGGVAWHIAGQRPAHRAGGLAGQCELAAAGLAGTVAIAAITGVVAGGAAVGAGVAAFPATGLARATLAAIGLSAALVLAVGFAPAAR